MVLTSKGWLALPGIATLGYKYNIVIKVQECDANEAD